MLIIDGVDLSRYRVRVYDEHFQGWLAPEENIELAALRVKEPSTSVRSQAHVLEVLLEPVAAAVPPQAVWSAGTPPGAWAGAAVCVRGACRKASRQRQRGCSGVDSVASR